MTVTKPFRRTCRQFVGGSYAEGGRSAYILHPQYATAPQQYIRAFLLLQQDLQRLFEFIEPADKNLEAYSYRTHELLLRACVEVEANCKAILIDNGYQKTKNLGMVDYCKLEATHRLSGYEIVAPMWHGVMSIRRPFEAWAAGAPLPWYQAYNATKHDRHTEFERATFGAAIDGISAVRAILSAQFYTQDFAPGGYWALESPDEIGIGGYFVVRFPDFPAEERYDFDWPALASTAAPFDQLVFV